MILIDRLTLDQVERGLTGGRLTELEEAALRHLWVSAAPRFAAWPPEWSDHPEGADEILAGAYRRMAPLTHPITCDRCVALTEQEPVRCT